MRTRIKCGNCGREFLEHWQSEHHICEKGLLARIKEWLRFRKLDRFDKFMSELALADPELYNEVGRAMQKWQKSRKIGCVDKLEAKE